MKTRLCGGRIEICIDSKGQKFSMLPAGTGDAVTVHGRVLRHGYADRLTKHPSNASRHSRTIGENHRGIECD